MHLASYASDNRSWFGSPHTAHLRSGLPSSGQNSRPYAGSYGHQRISGESPSVPFGSDEATPQGLPADPHTAGSPAQAETSHPPASAVPDLSSCADADPKSSEPGPQKVHTGSSASAGQNRHPAQTGSYRRSRRYGQRPTAGLPRYASASRPYPSQKQFAGSPPRSDGPDNTAEPAPGSTS